MFFYCTNQFNQQISAYSEKQIITFAQINMAYPRLAVFVLLLAAVSSIRMILHLNRLDGPKCFYQSLTMGEKYFLQVDSYGNQKYRIDIMQQVGDSWKEVATKESSKIVETFNKLATAEGTHMFCVSNVEDEALKIKLDIMSSLELGNLDHLPNLNDQENLHREIDWMDRQKDKLFESLNRLQSFRASSGNLNDMMSKKMIFIAILGLLCIVGVNYLFYVQARKTLKDRKLI